MTDEKPMPTVGRIVHVSPSYGSIPDYPDRLLAGKCWAGIVAGVQPLVIFVIPPDQPPFPSATVEWHWPQSHE